MENKKTNQNNATKNTSRKGKRAITALAITTAVLGATTIGFGVAYGMAQGSANQYKLELENVYNDNFYNLLESVNNLETKISKTLSASSSTYQRKTLLEASKNASEASISISGLPLSQNDIQDTVKLVNQISGYTSILADKLAEGESLTEEEMFSLQNVHQSVLDLKNQLNEFARKLNSGYSIVDSSMNVDTEGNEFSTTLSSLKSVDIEYPTMIYDGPFSDSVVNSAVKGLSGSAVSKEESLSKIEKLFSNSVRTDFEGETNGKFETYNYRMVNSDDEMLFIKVTKIGGHILTISGSGREGEVTIDYNVASDLAVKFAKENGIKNPQIVWSDSIDEDIYLNIAPTENGIILYPDLVKVKINMVSGTIVGYDATPYFTNHIDRNISKGSLTKSQAIGYLPSTFDIVSTRWVLSPLDYNREVVCMEVEADGNDGKYYFFFNGSSGELENVQKVIETDNGSLLM